MKLTEILIKPILTEKANAQQDKLSRYAFKVNRRANKLEIKTAVEQFYGVNVVDVNTLVVPGKGKTRYKAIMIVIWHFKELLKYLTGEVTLCKVRNAVSSTETITRVGDRRKYVSKRNGVLAITRMKTVNFKIIAILH